MPSGASPNLTRALELALQYLGFGGRMPPQVTAESVTAVLENGDVVAGETVLRTSGDVRAISAGQTVPVLWTRANPAPGHHGVKRALVLRHHARKGQPGPVTRQIIGAVVEELFAAPISPADARLDIWFRNDQQITRLKVTDVFPADTSDHDNYRVRWGVGGTGFLVIHDDASALPTLYVFTLDRDDPQETYGARTPQATLLRIEPWTQVTLTTVTYTIDEMDGQDIYADVGSSGRYYAADQTLYTDGTPAAPSVGTNDLAVPTASSAPIPVPLLEYIDDVPMLGGTLIEAALSEDQHVIITVGFGILEDWLHAAASLQRKRWVIYYALPSPHGGYFEDVTTPLDPTNDLLIDYGSSQHVAIIDLTAGACLWTSTGETLSLTLTGSFRRLYHGTNSGAAGEVLDSIPALCHLAAADGTAPPGAIQTTGYATSLSSYPSTLPDYVTVIDSVDIGMIGLAGGVGAIHGMSFVPTDDLTFEDHPLRIEQMPSSLIDRPGEGPLVGVADTFHYDPTGTTPDQQVVEITGTLRFARMPLVFISATILFPSSQPEQMRLALVVKRTRAGSDQPGQLAAFVIDGQGQPICTLMDWRAYTTPSDTVAIVGGNARHVMWGSPDQMHIVTTADPTAGYVGPFSVAEIDPRLLRPDFLYGAAESSRRILQAWDYSSGAVSRADPATPDPTLESASALQDLPEPPPDVWDSDYHAVDHPSLNRLGLPPGLGS